MPNCEEKLEKVKEYCDSMIANSLVGSSESMVAHAILNIVKGD